MKIPNVCRLVLCTQYMYLPYKVIYEYIVLKALGIAHVLLRLW